MHINSYHCTKINNIKNYQILIRNPQDKTKNFPRGVDRLLLNSGNVVLVPSLRLRPEPC